MVPRALIDRLTLTIGSRMVPVIRNFNNREETKSATWSIAAARRSTASATLGDLARRPGRSGGRPCWY